MKHNYKYYCKDYENIENYEAAKKDNFIGWECHHRLETHNSDGERRTVDITMEELKALRMYYHRPSSELIFLTSSEHSSLHKPSDETKKKMSEANKGKHPSEQTRKKMSEARKGEKHPLYGKHLSAETRNKISEARKEKCTGEDNPFYGKHHSEETRKKIGEANKVKMKGKRWYNNGKISKRAYECPEGFVHGRVK